ncbi:MAG: SDR family oxidoreductase [Treponema sp.]|nr:SDR family oxidoreductase [Treponema sp.]
MDLNLKNKIVVVTGGSKGIGFAIAKEFLAEGAEVFITGRNLESLKKAEQELSVYGKLHGVQGDGTVLAEIEAVAAKAAEKTGKIDVWVNNVGTNIKKKGEFYDEEEIDFLTSTLFKSAVFGIQSAVKYMKESGGSIVNISSLAARCATCGRSNIYASMKAALLALTKTSAGEYASKKIRVNAVLPGYTKTPLLEQGFSEKALERLLQGNLLRRMANPEEIAKPVVFLSSDAASYINGESVEVTGGHNIVLNPWQSYEN